MHNSLQTRLLKRLMRPVAKNWIVGETLSDAVKETKALNKKGMRVMINYIGEDVKSDAEAQRNFSEYYRIARAISGRLDADMTIKLTQFCTDLGGKKCRDSIAKLLGDAKRKKVFVWFDMESSSSTENTIRIYMDFLRTNNRIGICIQAALKRSESDLKKIVAAGGIVRLVKGAYHEKPSIAYTSHEDIMRNYFRLLKILFRSRKFAIGSHDDRIIDKVVYVNRMYNRDIEFQTLRGIRNDLVARLLKDGQKVSIYMPYGTEWLHYGLRRVRERKRNILLLLKSL